MLLHVAIVVVIVLVLLVLLLLVVVLLLLPVIMVVLGMRQLGTAAKDIAGKLDWRGKHRWVKWVVGPIA